MIPLALETLPVIGVELVMAAVIACPIPPIVMDLLPTAITWPIAMRLPHRAGSAAGRRGQAVAAGLEAAAGAE